MAQNTNDPNKPTILATEEARQGETSGRLRTVLGVSMALAVIAGIAFVVDYA